ncbi:MAG: rod shape-determining protein MreD [Candidatus Omnitrophica bacterium]|nr:rod shape-determining protein MreD [Candidatus Omnitrophota bacterium]
MNKILFLLSIVLLALLQATVLEYFKFFLVKPDLLLAIVVIASLSFRMHWAIFSALLAGFLKDAMGAYPFGINTIFFPLCSLMILRLSKDISIENNFVPLAIMFISVILSSIVMRLAFLFMGSSVVSIGIFIRVTFIESVYTVLVFTLLFKAFKRLLSYKK